MKLIQTTSVDLDTRLSRLCRRCRPSRRIFPLIIFALPVLTEQVRYDIDKGFATLTFTPDVFAAGATPIAATSGTFWVQTVKDEVYGIFSCNGRGLEIKEGKFRIKLPKNLRQ